MEAAAAVPEELRCKRSDGKQWRCSAPSMPDKTVCEKHYVQAKKRAASSALRASLRRSSASASAARGTTPPARMAVARPIYGRVAGEPVYVAEPALPPPPPPPRRRQPVHGLPMGNAAGARTAAELVGRGSAGLVACSSAAGAAAAATCHQCRRVANTIWCTSCDRRGYCTNCISRWYSDIPIDDVRKARVQEISAVDKLEYLHSILASVLPVLKQIYSDQCFEIGVDTKAYGLRTDIIRAKVNPDEQMCCDTSNYPRSDFCKVPVFDYHRHCPRCLYDLCLDCCRDIRRSRTSVARGEYAEGRVVDRSKDTSNKRARMEPSAESANDKSVPQRRDIKNIDIRSLFPTWRVNNDGSITCGPHEAGGCGSSKLVLRRIFKINWISKLVKNSEEMVNGCKVHVLENGCSSCNDGRTLELTGHRNFGVSTCSNNGGIDRFCVFSPVLEDLKSEGIIHFRKHWIKGEPVVIRNAFEPSLSSSWDPLNIWRGIQEIMDEEVDDDVIVKAVDCSNQAEVDIELKQFIKGYSDGHKGEDGELMMLKLKEWPPPSVLEEFLLCQRPEFIVNFPLVDFIHSRWGLLNLSAKLPPDTLQPEVGLKLLIAYGRHQEAGKGDSVTNLMINMADVVHMLMHTAKGHDVCPKRLQPERSEKIANGMTMHVNAHAPVQNLNVDMGEQSPDHVSSKFDERAHASALRLQEKSSDAKLNCGFEGSSTEFSCSSHSEEPKVNGSERSQAGAVWDVFCRQDISKLNEYLTANWEELAASSQVKNPIYEQSVYLNKYHKRILKDQYGIEPWTFQQQIGEAVFVPAGCPFQVKNLQSTVQLALDFLSPESLGESARMAQEIRCLPNDHDAKLKMLEIGKISLYAASSAVREIQRITLDPKFNLDLKFKDQNLTQAVSENLARVTKQRNVPCS
uniref:JmjC domain-containing protein n=1 Tax=Oryza glumipatula TaxID=40148 RepID=A0A0D9Z783_9ORYZ